MTGAIDPTPFERLEGEWADLHTAFETRLVGEHRGLPLDDDYPARRLAFESALAAFDDAGLSARSAPDSTASAPRWVPSTRSSRSRAWPRTRRLVRTGRIAGRRRPAAGDLRRVRRGHGRGRGRRRDDRSPDRLHAARDRGRRRRTAGRLRGDGPVWRAVDGDGGVTSPYRRLVAASAARWARDGSTIEANAAVLGIAPGTFEPMLHAILALGRQVSPTRPASAGRADRAVGLPLRRRRGGAPAPGARPARSPAADQRRPPAVARRGPGRARDRLRHRAAPGPAGHPGRVHDRRPAGAMGLRDLRRGRPRQPRRAAPRERARAPLRRDPDSAGVRRATAGLTRRSSRPSRTSSAGTCTNPRSRRTTSASPSSRDWRPLDRYGGVLLDACWTLFEIELHRSPGRRPNDVWAEVVADGLGIEPHPEWSWWAVRGQLIDSPGYLANYVLSAIAAAALRARIRELRGDWSTGDPGWYAFVAERLLRFGGSRVPADLIADLLGGPLTVEPVLADLRRAG